MALKKKTEPVITPLENILGDQAEKIAYLGH
jgi:hypothetical protein